MEEIKAFLIQNWQLLASVLLFIVSFIIGLMTRRKKGYTFSDILLGLIAEQLPQWISLAEASGGSGEQKKVQVLNDALNYASKTLGRKLSEEETSFLISNASAQIEKILGTPQKKDDPKQAQINKKSKYR
ncbi:MAG: hypothetical protein J6V44_01690 [Methanobrevibacter sp.]|nr:hypothetical protein [Methanobrevibacter sp.]